MVCKVLFSSHKIYLHFTELVNHTQWVLTWAKIPSVGQGGFFFFLYQICKASNKTDAETGTDTSFIQWLKNGEVRI